MEHHLNWFTALLNKWLAAPVNSLLHALGLHAHDPENPIIDPVAMSLVVVLLGMLFFMWLKRRLSVEQPGAMQQMVEALITNPLGLGVRDLLDQNVGHNGRKYLPMVGTVGIFILLGNAISLFPGFNSPTAHPSAPLACAIVSFVYYNFQGMRHHSPVGYGLHFAGPVWWLAPLMIPVELISHSARILSLTVRLWANIFSSELLYFTFLGLLIAPMTAVMEHSKILGYLLGVFPLVLPIVFILLHAFVALVQAFVFTILPSIYIGMAVAEEH